MRGPSRPEKAKDSLVKAVGDLGSFARTASAQLIEQAGDLKDATVDTVEKLGAKKPDPYEEAVADYNAAFAGLSDRGCPSCGCGSARRT